jgi:hypothetical protein
VFTSTVLPLLVSPFLVLVAVFGVVVVVALLRAKPDDVPGVLRDSMSVFRRLADRMPGPVAGRHAVSNRVAEEHNPLQCGQSGGRNDQTA